MKVVVVGATGNVGTSVVQALCADSRVEHVVGVARRPGGLDIDGVEWARADIRSADLVDLFAEAAAVVHLAWLIQPSHRPDVLASVNIDGTRRVCEAVLEARVPALVYASSVGAYSPGPKTRRVDESWPTSGIATSSYALHKATVERMLDEFHAASPETRVVRLRPGLIFKRSAGAQIRRYFLGRAAPVNLARPGWIPVVPMLPGLRFQIVHADDVAEAYRLAVVTDASGAYNVATEPPLDPHEFAKLLRARPVPVPRRLARAALWSSWRAHLQPTGGGWLDMALAVPVMTTDRIRADLGWRPDHDSRTTLLELLDGLRHGDSLPHGRPQRRRPDRAANAKNHRPKLTAAPTHERRDPRSSGVASPLGFDACRPGIPIALCLARAERFHRDGAQAGPITGGRNRGDGPRLRVALNRAISEAAARDVRVDLDLSRVTFVDSRFAPAVGGSRPWPAHPGTARQSAPSVITRLTLAAAITYLRLAGPDNEAFVRAG